jgi:hypothetical protein
VENVTQWCKREGCWNSVQTIQYTLSEDIESCLIGQEEIRSAVRDAKADQRIVSDAEIMTKIVSIPAELWQNALVFAANRKLVSPDEMIALRIAGQMPGKVPTPFQCKRLLVVLERLEEEGFKL